MNDFRWLPKYTNWDFESWLSLFNMDSKLSGLKNLTEFMTKTIPHKYVEKDGNLTLEIVVTGHKPDNIKVKFCEKAHTLRVEDIVDTAEHENRSGSEKPWWYNELNLEVVVPETINNESFKKHLENGVLTITATYEQASEKEEEFEVC